MNERQKKFIEFYVTEGGSQFDAAIKAGYSEKSARVTACRLLQQPEVQAYMRKVQNEVILQRVPKSAEVLMKLLESEDEKIRLAAAKDMLDRGGFKAVEQVEHTFKDERTDEELDAEIQSLMTDLKDKGKLVSIK